MQHELKILPQYFKSVKEGAKTFEIRTNDRGFKVGDTLILEEYEKGHYTLERIRKEVAYILEGGQCGLEEGYCILGLKQEGLILKNIDLTGISIIEQINKVKEEETEFMIAIELGNKENAIEEFFDDMQVKLGLLEKVFGIKADKVMGKYDKHLEKIKFRPRNKQCNKCIQCDKREREFAGKNGCFAMKITH